MGGCVGSSDVYAVSTTRLIQQLNRVKLTSEHEQLKLLKDVKSQQAILESQFNKEPPQRNKGVEKAMIGRVVYTNNIRNIWIIIENDARKLLQYKNLIGTAEGLQNVSYQANQLLYATSILNNDQVTKFSLMLKKRYPQKPEPTDQQITTELLRYYKHTSEATSKMEYEYIMEFCQNKGYELEKINKVGHGYKYNMT